MSIHHEELEGVLTLCNSLQLATLCLSTDLYITHMNYAAEILFLHTQQEVIGKSFHELCGKLGIILPQDLQLF